jgi:hypothetical protein
MRNTTALLLLTITLASASLAQSGPTPAAGSVETKATPATDSVFPTNRDLASKARTVFVESDTFYMKREHLQSALLGRKEFKAWQLQITNRLADADLLIVVKRVPFSNHFNYTVTDRFSDTVIMAGKVDSLAGTVYGLIAGEFVQKMKVYRGDPLAKQAAPKP